MTSGPMVSQGRNFQFYPRCQRGAYLYAVLYSDGAVKIGRTSNPVSRIPNLKKSTHDNAATISGVFVSELMDGDRGSNTRRKQAEQLALADARALGVPLHGKEMFCGLSFEQATRIIRSRVAGYQQIFAPSKAGCCDE